MNKIYILGIGPGHPDYVLPITQGYIEKSHILIGGERNLETFPNFKGTKVIIKKDLDSLVNLMKRERESNQISLILSGDTGFYSMLSFMKKHFSDDEIEVIPGISSFQYLFAKMKEPWQQIPLRSVHGRRDEYLQVFKTYGQVTLLTDHQYGPEVIARELIGAGYGQARLIVGENLSYDNEKITIGTPGEIIEQAPYQMSVVVIKDE